MTHSTTDGKIKVIKITNYNNTYKVLLENKMILNLNIEQLLEYRISLDKSFTKNELDKIIDESDLYCWYLKSIKYISFKLRTKYEIETYLKNKKLNNNLINKIMDKLIQNNYIDDYRYTKYFVDECINNGKGAIFFSKKLEYYKVSLHIIDNFITKFYEDDTIQILAKYYLKEKSKLNKYQGYVIKQKLINKMIRNGLNEEVIDKVINNVYKTCE